METQFYERKPEVIEAVELSAENYIEIAKWTGGLYKLVATRPHIIELTIPNVFGNQKAQLKFYAKRGATTEEYSLIDKQIHNEEFPTSDLRHNFEYNGDMIIRKNNRFSVLSQEEFRDTYELLSDN